MDDQLTPYAAPFPLHTLQCTSPTCSAMRAPLGLPRASTAVQRLLPPWASLPHRLPPAGAYAVDKVHLLDPYVCTKVYRWGQCRTMYFANQQHQGSSPEQHGSHVVPKCCLIGRLSKMKVVRVGNARRRQTRNHPQEMMELEADGSLVVVPRPTNLGKAAPSCNTNCSAQATTTHATYSQ